MPGLLNSHVVPLSPSFSFLRILNSFLPYCFFIIYIFLLEGNTLCIWLIDFYFRSQKNFFLALLSGTQDLSFLNRDQTQAPCNGSTKSQPLNHQGSPFRSQFKFFFWRYTFPDLSNLCQILAVTSYRHLYIFHKQYFEYLFLLLFYKFHKYRNMSIYYCILNALQSAWQIVRAQ